MQFATKIYNLRAKERLSQEEFAEKFGVSRQAVQKWENGSSLPETAKLIEISKYFGVSVDSLLLDRCERMSEEYEKILPSYEKITDWEFYASEVMTEYNQCIEEGLDVSAYRELFTAISKLPKNSIKKELGDVVQKIVLTAKPIENYPYNEPSGLDEIKMLRKDFELPTEEIEHLDDKIHGAWMGRVCGCMLGKTVEGIRSEELVPFLKQTDNYPMHRYILKTDLEKVDLSSFNFGFIHRPYIDTLGFMPVDDDTNYTVLAQIIYQNCGCNFTPDDVANAWLRYQNKDAYCTAERVAFCNFVKGYRPPKSAVHKNAYREWIGAQIRGDYWGYVNPGNPERAAEMAWRDACISHTKNGIYGEMFASAMIAAAAVTSNVEKIIFAGLSQIPYTSRLYARITEIIDAFHSGRSSAETFEHIHSLYDEHTSHGWCHTISNAMIVAASLLYGNGDFGKSICMAVETGFDTDCNGATVGSILGMALGFSGIDEKWSKPFNDTLDTSIFGVGSVKISERAKMTLEHIKTHK